MAKIIIHLKGGPTSGNFNHAGIPGHQGGSAPSGTGGSTIEATSGANFTAMNKQLAAMGWERGDDDGMELHLQGNTRRRTGNMFYRAVPNQRDGTYRLAYMSGNRFDKLNWSYAVKEYKTAAGVDKAARAHFDKLMGV